MDKEERGCRYGEWETGASVVSRTSAKRVNNRQGSVQRCGGLGCKVCGKGEERLQSEEELAMMM